MLKIAGLWQIQYDVTVVLDPDNLVSKPQYDVVGRLYEDPGKTPRFFVNPAKYAPINGGFIVAVPGKVFYDRFSDGIAHRYSKTTGWGGTYTATTRDYMRTRVSNSKNPVTHSVCCRRDRRVYNALKRKDCEFCWVNAAADQGILWYMGFGSEVCLPPLHRGIVMPRPSTAKHALKHLKYHTYASSLAACFPRSSWAGCLVESTEMVALSVPEIVCPCY
eukprot:scaffold1061_cov213-Prasinococcus_capsulatus_cf.AAC.6